MLYIRCSGWCHIKIIRCGHKVYFFSNCCGSAYPHPWYHDCQMSPCHRRCSRWPGNRFAPEFADRRPFSTDTARNQVPWSGPQQRHGTPSCIRHCSFLWSYQGLWVRYPGRYWVKIMCTLNFTEIWSFLDIFTSANMLLSHFSRYTLVSALEGLIL